MKLLGERIKRRRENLRLQLNELAKKVGISSSALSQIEKAKALPSIIHLKVIAENLHTTVGELIGEHEALSNIPLLRSSEIQFVKENQFGCKSYLLSYHCSNKQMYPLLLKLSANSNSSGILNSYPGQTFLFVLIGEIEINLDGISYSLKQNDNFYLNAQRPHLIENKRGEEAQIIVVSTPPEV